MSKQELGNKLNCRDFINIGIYAAIYFVIVMALAMTGLGMIFIMSLIMGIMMFVRLIILLEELIMDRNILILS